MANEGIELKVFKFGNLFAQADVLNGRKEPQFLDQIKALGGGSFKISKSDPKVVNDPSLLASRNMIKACVDGQTVGAFFITSRSTTSIGEGEASEEAYEIAGQGLKSWFDDAEVRPYGGLNSASMNERNFSWASERGDWYIGSQWTPAISMGAVHTLPVYADMPGEWPEGNIDAQWIWGSALNGVGTHPIGFNYFRREFTSSATQTYALYVAGDNGLQVYVDGSQLLATSANASAFDKAQRLEFTLAAGDHVLAFAVENYAQTVNNPGGLLAALYQMVPSTTGTAAPTESLLLQTGGSGWVVNSYPAAPPGWTAGEVMLTLMAEAEARGVLFPTYLTPTFTTTTDSAGNPWNASLDWSFGVGDSMLTVITRMEELVCDIWINPDDFKLYAVAQRGKDRSVFSYDTDGISVLDTPVIFERGKNLRASSTEARGKIKNSLSLKTAEGWLGVVETATASAGIYGVIEGTLETNSSVTISKQLADLVFEQKAMEEEGAAYDVWPTDKIPFADFQIADWVSAPNELNLQVMRRVLSIAVSESDGGRALYTIEFDTIFQTREERIANIVSKGSGGGTGGGYSNSGGGGGNLGNPIILPPGGTTPTQKIPKKPTNLAATSEGQWSPNGVTAFSEVTLTWDPVTEATDGSAMIPSTYEVWAHLKGSLDTGFIQYAVVTTNKAIVRPFNPGTVWTFKVVAVANNRYSAYSDELDHTMVGPLVPLLPPTAPALSSDKGVLIVSWDGLLNNNQVPPPQFRYVYALVSGTSGSGYNRVGGVLQRDGRNLYISGGVVGTTYYVRFVAVDGAGITSQMSLESSTVLTGVNLGNLDQDVADAIDAAEQAGKDAQGTDNLLADPSFEQADDKIWNLGNANVTRVTTTPRTGARALRAKAITSAYEITRYQRAIPVQENDNYYISIFVRPQGSGSVTEGAIAVGLAYGSTTATSDGTINLGSSVEPGAGYTRVSGEFIIPEGSGIRYVRPRFVMLDTTNTNVYLLDDAVFMMQVGTTLIVDGAVITNKIRAGAVIAEKISASAVTAEKIQAGAVIAGKIAANAVTANEILAGTITANQISAGTIDVTRLKSGIGGDIDITANDTVTIIAGQINDIGSQAGDNAANLEEMQTYYAFGPTGAIISTPISPYQVALRSDRIEMLELGTPVSSWNAGQMQVRSFVGDEVVLGNHKLERYLDGTVVRAI